MKKKLKSPKRTTHKPNFYLRFKGKWNYKRGGITVVKAYVQHLVKKADSIQSQEWKYCEDILKDNRLKAGNALSFLKLRTDEGAEENSVSLNKAKNAIKAINTLVDAYEDIQHTHATFEERTLFVRTNNDSKISQYLSAVPEDIGYEYSDDAFCKYIAVHIKGDEAIAHTVDSIYESKGDE